MRYDHTQTSPLYLILLSISAIMLVSATQVPDRMLQLLLGVVGVSMLLLAYAFRELNVRDAGDGLLVSFGPLSLFRRTIPYNRIASVERGRTTLLEGWGIHISPGGGWVWNLWGFDCVDIRFKKGSRLRIGTDDPDGLEAFLKERVGTGSFQG